MEYQKGKKMSTEAITELFEDALEKEKYALELYSSVYSRITDTKTKIIIKKINSDEEEHIRNVEKILQILRERQGQQPIL